MATTTLVRGRAVLTGRLDLPEVTDGAVAIEGSRIVDVGPYTELRRRFSRADEVGSSDRIVLPGLVSAHQHGGGASSIQLGCADGPFERWLIEMMAIPPLDVRYDTAYHAGRLLASGITTTVHSHYIRDPARYRDEVDEILAGYADIGMRVAFAPHYIDRNFLTYGDDDAFVAGLPADLRGVAQSLCAAAIGEDDYLALVAELAERADGDRERILFGPVAPQWCTPRALGRIAEAVKGSDLGAHTHLLETATQRAYLDEDARGSVVSQLDATGMLGPRTSLAHCVWLTSDEISLLARRGSTVVLNPGCNLRLGNGLAPVAELVAAGVCLAVGTDDMTLGDDDDLFSELRLVAGLGRVSGTWIEPAHLMRMATSGGARAALFDDSVGTIEPGRQADLVLLDTTRILEPVTFAGVSMLDLTLARARASDVRTVLIGGTVRLDDGALVGGDLHSARQAIGKAARPEWGRPDRATFKDVVGRIAAARAQWPDVVSGSGAARSHGN